jgi:hypothetical protein
MKWRSSAGRSSSQSDKPVAKLMPEEEEPINLFGRMAGSVKICGDIISPIEDAGWTGDEENI